MAGNDIHRFARMGDLDAIRKTVLGGTDINVKDQFGTTALLSAIAEKQVNAAHLLLQLGADATVQDKGGSTALHYAIEHELPTVLESLLRKCPEAVSISDKHGNQPLWTAAFNARGANDMVSMLLRCGADPEHRNNVNRSPLDVAKRKGDDDLFRLLKDTPFLPRPPRDKIGGEDPGHSSVGETSLAGGPIQETCPGCDTAIGQLHEPFCNRELCPFCRDFVTTCECIFNVLSLSADERKIVEDFEDDSVEPLRSICDRWFAAVEAQGRIPY
jgi:Ankyrin repeats (3 copies)/Ankyrin repeat